MTTTQHRLAAQTISRYLNQHHQRADLIPDSGYRNSKRGNSLARTRGFYVTQDGPATVVVRYNARFNGLQANLDAAFAEQADAANVYERTLVSAGYTVINDGRGTLRVTR